MPFGFENASETLNKATDAILASVKWESTMVYSNNFVILI